MESEGPCRDGHNAVVNHAKVTEHPLHSNNSCKKCGRFLYVAFLTYILFFYLITAKAEELWNYKYTRWWKKNRARIAGTPITDEEKWMSWSLPFTAPTQVGKKQAESSNLYEGDIYKNDIYDVLLTPQQSNRRFLKGIHTWSDGNVPYVLENTFDQKERLHLARAMTEIETKSCIRFYPKTVERDYVYIHKGKDCASNVGKIGGGQPLSLAPRCVHFGIILHELMHVLGFWHEQSRYDRRNYVNIHWFNIKPQMITNFFISPYYTLSDVGLPYDYNSILHYSTTTFARDPKRPTISPKTDGVHIGQRKGLSDLNLKSMNLLYNCENQDYFGVNTNEYALATLHGECLDLWPYICTPFKYMGGCYWGEIVLRRYCRYSCGMC